ncbi:hypothetical protein J2W39_004521 [Variovorax paradoxus]|uniref:Rhamnogalacturonase A/B/Epimerase-like pectate lyase domain-containing protein n=1 Tax=Variovorax paradoxus TaxID=34073 RepID=A0AAW8ELF8_VARPD|nr:glycosyl hydrolase family 28-related protein [Variovorax paradoxus]MDP9973274.1 hypothetical protein [Variovorax paradoxus]
MKKYLRTFGVLVAVLSASCAFAQGNTIGNAINVTTFGVQCNGTADDTGAINTALSTAGGRTLIFPAGVCRYSGGGVLSNGTTIVGAGRNATVIRATTSNATLFNVGGYGAGIRSIKFNAAVPQTGGSYVVLSGPESFIEDFFMTGDYNGILMTGNVARIRHGRFQDGAPGAIRIRAEGGDNSQLIDDVLMGAQQPQVSFAGIRVRNSAALIISNTSVIQQGTGLLIDPYSSTLGGATDAGMVASLWVHHCFFDNSSGSGIAINATGSGSVVRSRFDSVWAGSSGSDGVRIVNNGSGTVSGIHFTSPHFLLNAGSGITTGGTVSDVSITGGEIGANSFGAYFNPGLTSVRITDSRIGNGAGVGGNSGAGVVISSGVDYVILSNNDLRGNGSAIANPSSSPNQLITNNFQ